MLHHGGLCQALIPLKRRHDVWWSRASTRPILRAASDRPGIAVYGYRVKPTTASYKTADADAVAAAEEVNAAGVR